MQFSSSILAFSLLALVASSPLPKKENAAASSTASGTAVASKATAAAAASSDVLSAQAYNDFQISGPTAGTAESKANAIFSGIDMNNLASVSAADLKVIKGVHDAAEDAEVQAFNPAIKAASGAAADALQNGKIENKVLKLTAEVLGIQVEAAQGGDDSDLAAEQKKLANNIALDTAAAGQDSTPVSFDATS
ncbi:hypothetical protein BKA65DRAFT_449308 [Rhexocercosporidium sp. MPI-PUGE-AT-0058]|nr:hypothetical protein BKA65DRAFT_449308 [Rhexocercosporidium sp. MPI-PUGE-AT-0058]